MLTKSLLYGLISIPLLAQVAPDWRSESKDVVPAMNSSGAITLPAARLKIDLAYPRGKKERCELTVVYDPDSGHYLWHVTPSNPGMPDDTVVYLKFIKAGRAVAYADPAGLTEFSAVNWAKTWLGHAASLDAAVSASISEIGQRLAWAETRGYHLDYKLLPLGGDLTGFPGAGVSFPIAKIAPGVKPIPSEFACEPNQSLCRTDHNTIASISKQGTNWRLVLRNRWDVEAILDQNFNVVSLTQLTQPKL
jgi:hypothetical protein